MDNFVAALCGIELETDRAKALEMELCGLAEKLAAAKRCLVHRDLQSQNVMIYREEPFLIDFQGCVSARVSMISDRCCAIPM